MNTLTMKATSYGFGRLVERARAKPVAGADSGAAAGKRRPVASLRGIDNV
ncbi:hypothetical protein SAMN05519104_4351 [Rhizobiales bacterium GAS188]|nr:hypothetical protein SAMN05519104_4351 [Rhizobiales bacterium GAS188]